MTDPTLPRADEVLREVLAGPDTGLDGSPVVASFTAEDQIRALFACLPPDSDHLVIRRSDLAVMGLPTLTEEDAVFVDVWRRSENFGVRGLVAIIDRLVSEHDPGCIHSLQPESATVDDCTCGRLVAPGSPTVPEPEEDSHA